MFSRLAWSRVASTFALVALLGGFAASEAQAEVTFKQNQFAISVPAGSPYSLDLSTLLMSAGTQPLTWSVFGSVPSWLQFDNVQTVAGNPALANVGTSTFSVSAKVQGTTVAGAIAQISLTVVSVPQWSSNPITFTANEASQFTLDLRTKVSDPSGQAVSVSIVPGQTLPGWLTYVNGVLSGMPARADVGTVAPINFLATSASGGTAPVQVTGTVLKTIHAPKWTAASFNLGNGTEDTPFSQDVTGATYIQNDDSVPLTFAVTAGPSDNWLTVTPQTGILSGIPRRPDINTQTVTVQLTGTSGTQTWTSSATFTLTVAEVHHPPTWNNPVQLPDALTGMFYTEDLTSFVNNVDGNPLTFTVQAGGPAWASVLSGTKFSGTPGVANLGANTFTVIVNDGFFQVPTTVNVNVKKRPPTATNPINLPDGKEGTAYTANVANQATDPDGTTLTWALAAGTTTWITLAPNGAITGMPVRANVGANAIPVVVSDAYGDSINTVININVQKTNHPPTWTTPIPAPDAPERSPYAFDLTPYAKNVDGTGALTYAKVSGPAWLAVSKTGQLSGTPQRADVGPVSLVVSVTDTNNLSANVTVTFNVTKVPRPPVWAQNPITFTTAARQPFTQNIAAQAKDLDGEALTFAESNGPAWLTVGTDGSLSGTPPDSAVGTNTFALTVTNTDNQSAPVQLVITVTYTNHPPVPQANALTFTVKERQVLPVNLNTPTYVTNQDSLPLTFSIANLPAWATLTPQGQLTLSPLRPQIGTYTWQLAIASSAGNVTAPVQVTVVKDPRPPVWAQNPIAYSAPARAPFTANLGSQVKDLDGETLTLAMTSAPTWLQLNSDGTISGTPGDANVGANTFTFTATNTDGMSAPVEVDINVTYTVHPPTLVPNAMAFTVKERQTLSDNLGLPKYVNNPDNLPLVFTAPAASWYTIGASGAITLSPLRAQVGTQTIPLQITSGATSLTTQVIVTVVKDPRAPVWAQNPISYGAQSRIAFTANLASQVKDLDGETVTLAMTSAPTWLKLNADGTISGTPDDTNVGANTFTFTATNTDGMSAPVTVNINVTYTPHQPALVPNAMVFNVPERTTVTDNLALPKYVTNPDNLPLTFTAPTGAWYTISTAGAISLSPLRAQVGTQTIPLQIAGGTTTLTTQVIVNVTKVPRPPIWAQNPITFTTPARTLFTNSIAAQVKDQDGETLTIAKIDGPAWLTISPSGGLSGTPDDTMVGTNTFDATATNSDGQSAPVQIVITVTAKPHPPVWTQNEIDLPQGQSQVVYPTQQLAPFVKPLDPGLTMKFAKVSGNAWVTIGTDGSVNGTPTDADVGTDSITVSVTTSAGDSANVLVKIPVIPAPVPPKWTQDPIQLADATQDQPYSFSVVPFVANPSNLPLTFSLLNGPTWLSISAGGTLTGTPAKADALQGNYTAVIQVTDGKHPVQVGALGRVIRVWAKPVIAGNITFTVKERSTTTINLADPQYVTNPESVTLTFLPVAFANWLSLSPQGSLVLKPLYANIGTTQFQFTVNDGHNGPIAGTFTVIVQRDPRPPVWTPTTINLTATAGKPFSTDLSQYAKDLDGIPLTYSIQTGPTWLAINATTGVISGTPQEANDGVNNFVVVAKNDLLPASANVIITVVTGIQPPAWTQNPIRLPNAKATQAYTQSLASYVKDPNGLALTFQKSSGPDWAFITSAGLVIGTPAETDVGDNSFVVRATNTQGGYAEVTVMILVVTAKTAPQWTQNPIPLGNAIVGQPFTFDLTKYVVDSSGAVLTYKMLTGPTWLVTNSTGQLSGTPQSGNLGPYTATFEVSNGALTADVNAFGKVINPPQPPVLNLAALQFTVTVNTTKTVNLNQAAYVTNPDPTTNPLTFTLTNNTDTWITLTTAGTLNMAPLTPQIGAHTYTLTVTNANGLAASGPVLVTVVDAPKPPVWSQQTITFTTYVGQPFYVTINDYVTDPAGKKLTFAKISGPAWLSTSGDGTLSGTPQQSDVGTGTFDITARNDSAGADVTVIVIVKSKDPIDDKTTIDDPVPGAQAEQLWVIDTWWPYMFQKNTFIQAFSDALPTFYDKLDKATQRIHHKGVYVNANVKFKGVPEPDKNGNLVMSWDDQNWVSDFRYRMQKDCNCTDPNTPIWTMWLFYQLLPSQAFYQKDWFVNNVPMDVLIATRHVDYFRKYATGTQASWQASDFANSFIAQHVPPQKPYRINVIAPKCLTMLDPVDNPNLNPDPDPSNPPKVSTAEYDASTQAQQDYSTLTTKTKGKYWPTDCGQDLTTILSAYADQIIFSAYVTGKQRIKLSQKPADPTQIQVFLAGKQLPGNTGNATTDLWTYDATTNEILIQWNKIDLSTLKSGDQIEIKYFPG